MVPEVEGLGTVDDVRCRCHRQEAVCCLGEVRTGGSLERRWGGAQTDPQGEQLVGAAGGGRGGRDQLEEQEAEQEHRLLLQLRGGDGREQSVEQLFQLVR